METVAAFGVGLALLAGLAGTIVARLPGLPLCWTATIVWAAIDGSRAAWIAVGVATALAVANYLVQHRLAGGGWSELAVSDRSWMIGAGVAIAGAWMAKLPGMIFGFIGGIYMAERRRLAREGTARNVADRTDAQRPVVISRVTLAEFGTAAAIGVTWMWAFAG